MKPIENKGPKRIYRKDLTLSCFSIIGMIIGYLIFHPYTMFVYLIMNKHQRGDVSFHIEDIFTAFFATLTPEMFPMAIAFAFFGSLNGLLIGLIIDKKERLHAAEHENEKKKVALETLQRLMITLSHYLLNANTVIAGMARRCLRYDSKEDIKDSVDIIEKEAQKIEAVIKAFKKITEIKIADYTSEGKGLMIDITREIEEQLDKDKIQSS